MRIPLRVSDLDGTGWEVELYVARSVTIFEKGYLMGELD